MYSGRQRPLDSVPPHPRHAVRHVHVRLQTQSCGILRHRVHARVNESVIKRHGLASSAAEAWEQGGGGSFKRTIRKAGTGTAVSTETDPAFHSQRPCRLRRPSLVLLLCRHTGVSARQGLERCAGLRSHAAAEEPQPVSLGRRAAVDMR